MVCFRSTIHCFSSKRTFFQQKGKNSGQDADAVECLVEINIVGGFHDLAELCGCLSKEGGQIGKSLVPKLASGRRRNELKDFLSGTWNLPEFVPEIRIVGRNIDFDQGRDGLPELFA